MIFFDVLGWFFVCYPDYVGVIINICICVLVLITIVAYIWSMASNTGMFRRRIFAKFGILAALQLCGVCLSVGFAICIALFLDAVGLSMAWFSQTWMIFGLYFCPMFFGLGILPAIYFSRTKEVSFFSFICVLFIELFIVLLFLAWSTTCVWHSASDALALLNIDSDYYHNDIL